MLRNDVIVDEHIAPSPFVGDTDLICDLGQTLKKYFRDRRAISIELLRDVLPAALAVLKVPCQSGEEGVKIRVGLCVDGRKPVRQDESLAVVRPFPSRIRMSPVTGNLGFNFPPPCRFVVTVLDLLPNA